VPHFSISIAVEERRPGSKSEITQGLVYQPLTDESFWAEKGRGAWLNERRLRVSARRDLSETLIGTGIPHLGRGNVETWAKIYGAIAPEVAAVRRFGSAALDLAWVAAARMDGFWEDDLDIWDTAAGLLLVREAGGFVTDYRGSDQMFGRREYLAGNNDVHSRLHKLLSGALRKA
jgi:myo-inositol-1(or 4)-monophosphatase